MPAGTLARLENGSLLCVARADKNAPLLLHRSDDEGRSWSSRPVFDESLRAAYAPGPTGGLLRTRNNVLVLAFYNAAERHWTWSDELHDAPGARLPCCVATSRDEGRTWSVQTLHEDWTGAIRDIIQTRSGRVIFTAMKMLHHPGRHATMTYSSDDDGRTWHASNLTDLGGAGHHDGGMESTIVELRDGRILEYIRTNWDHFWRSESHDGGLTWHAYGPTDIDASSSPGILKRLASGRIVLAWNRLHPQTPLDHSHRVGTGNQACTSASWHRNELSIAFSEDECRSWSDPVVIARHPDGEISYPAIFEAAPGELWITCHRWNWSLRLREDDW